MSFNDMFSAIVRLAHCQLDMPLGTNEIVKNQRWWEGCDQAKIVIIGLWEMNYPYSR